MMIIITVSVASIAVSSIAIVVFLSVIAVRLGELVQQREPLR